MNPPEAEMGARGLSLEIAVLARLYRDRLHTPAEVIAEVYERIESRGEDCVWIDIVPRAAAMAAAHRLGNAPDGRPLWGIPFAVKDNFDVAGVETTAACPAFAYRPAATATAVRRLIDEGALFIGKTNLDQFATGLNGTRSPYGAPSSPFDPLLISGGSSSGSAVAVSAGLVSFALGTDTAGSGRVPAAFTGIVGIKPSRGLVSSTGMVPACRSLDCTSVFALTVADGAVVLNTIAGFDVADPWSRAMAVPAAAPVGADLAGLVLGIPQPDELGLEEGYAEAWATLTERLAGAGVRLVPTSFAPFFEAGGLLYEGPWLADRLSGIEDFVDNHAEDLHPITRDLLARGRTVTGADAFRGITRLRELQRIAAAQVGAVDAMLTPTAPTTFSIQEMLDDPITKNTVLGRFTTFGNLLDLAAIALPGGFTPTGTPFGVSLLSAAGTDQRLAELASSMERLLELPLGATGQARAAPAQPAAAREDDGLLLAVVGAHLSGMPLNVQLVELGARFVSAARTTADYRLYALPGGTVAKPGLVRVGSGGVAVEVEVYRMPLGSVGAFLRGIGSPLGIGTLQLEDGSAVHGFLCEPIAVAKAVDISEYGGWRRYVSEALLAG